MASVFEGGLTDRDAQLLKVLFVRLHAALGASPSVIQYRDRPAAGSPSATARASKSWDAYELFGVFHYSAEDHLRTIQMLFEGPRLPTYALYTLLRAAADALVRCAYLLDADIDEKQRLARALKLQLENLGEKRKAVGDDKLYPKQLEGLEARAVRFGLPVARSPKDNEIKHFGESLPDDVGLFSRYVSPLRAGGPGQKPLGDMLYRFLSGQVHSMLWVMLLQSDSKPSGEPGMRVVKLDLKFEWFAGMLSVVLRVHERNMLNLLRLSGAGEDVWTAALGPATERAKARYVELATLQQK